MLHYFLGQGMQCSSVAQHIFLRWKSFFSFFWCGSTDGTARTDKWLPLMATKICLSESSSVHSIPFLSPLSPLSLFRPNPTDSNPGTRINVALLGRRRRKRVRQPLAAAVRVGGKRRQPGKKNPVSPPHVLEWRSGGRALVENGETGSYIFLQHSRVILKVCYLEIWKKKIFFPTRQSILFFRGGVLFLRSQTKTKKKHLLYAHR